LFKTIICSPFLCFCWKASVLVKRGLDGNEVGFTKTRIVTMVSAIHNP